MTGAMNAQADSRMDEPEDQVLGDATRVLNIALLALEGIFERRGAAFVRGWSGRDWFEWNAAPDALRRLKALLRELR